ncbi:glutamate receptor ionotropic, kainate 2 isoform X2 [Teleopsis dalmanni]|uniref:glutamate receptor ionotropic, kainate 2 isoform X2 n=1 Tax=Teleopsis dalmanni TaxID=139649 RepID=UPI0018CF4070|nr:glutamate receptor ionotropic, kainate 2 isoform X2 [Teleopsis dalmanni]
MHQIVYTTVKVCMHLFHVNRCKVSLSVIILLYWIVFGTALPPVIRLGAIFTEDQRNSKIESSFKYAIYRINKDKAILMNTQLVYDIEYVPRDDTFRTTKRVCRQLETGVQSIFGPSNPLLASHIQSICETFDVPHVEIRIDLDRSIKEFSINLYPSQHHMNLAYRDLMVYLNWTKVAIIYEEDYGLFKQQDLMYTTADMRTEMYIRQVSSTLSSYRQVLRAIRQKEIYKIIVDTSAKHIKEFFRAILQLQMNDYRYHYMFTTFDMDTYDLEDFKYNGVNITAFRLVDVESKRYEDIVEQMQKFQHNGLDIINGRPYIQTQSALMFDAVYAFAAGLKELDRSHTLSLRNLSCDSEESWSDGLSLYNYINSATFDGLTGKVRFSDGHRSGFQIDLLKLKHDSIQKVGYWNTEVGINITDPNAFYDINNANITLLVVTREEKPYVMVKQDTNLTGNARFEGFCIDLLKAIAVQVGFQYNIELVPDNMYGVYNPETNTWNGIVRELMESRADLAVASMTINYARESVIDFTKPFMNLGIGILFKKSDRAQTRFFSFMNPLAVDIWFYIAFGYILVSLTIWIVARFSPIEWQSSKPSCSMACKHNSEEINIENREQQRIENEFKIHRNVSSEHLNKILDDDKQNINFVQLDMKNVNKEIHYDSKPLKYNFIESDKMRKKSVNIELSYTKPVPDIQNLASMECEHDDETELVNVQNDFTLKNSFWFAISALMQQGCDLYPRATSTRIVGGIWWFFTLIIISSYTANLAAFLTVERMHVPIESASDLAEQTDIAYGTLEGGSTMTFFRDSKIGIYQKMWRYMENRKSSVFVKTYDDGIRRVMDGNYAFLMESTMLDFAVQRDCNLTQIGGLLDSKGYGIATPKGSQWRDPMSLAILELQEKGIIQILYDKWWKNTGDVCNRDDKNKESKANALGVENIGGVFVVLLCGLALSVVVAILEFCWNSKKHVQNENQSLCSEMAEELRFAMQCHASKQRPALKRNCMKCTPATTYVPTGVGMPHIGGVQYNYFN